jgi:hypothetical protein
VRYDIAQAGGKEDEIVGAPYWPVIFKYYAVDSYCQNDSNCGDNMLLVLLLPYSQAPHYEVQWNEDLEQAY